MSEWVREIPSVRQQYLLLKEIWGTDVEPGYVFLPWIPGELAPTSRRGESFKNGPAFAWPPSDDGEMIKRHLKEHQKDDLYFTPATFVDMNRSKEEIGLERALWADLDETDPRQMKGYQPTIAWESSPGRYQAVWLFRTAMPGASNPGDLNQRLTYHIGADHSGWDATQLLRVPGSKNHKRSVEGEQGYLLFRESPRPNWKDFYDLPPVPKREAEDVDLIILEEKVNRVDLSKVKAKIRKKVKRYVWELIHADDVGDNDRSTVIWQISREMADHGCAIEEIIAILRDSPWNKYEDRSDGDLKHLARDASKAIAERVNQNLDTLDISPEWDKWSSFTEWYWAEDPVLEWLVPEFWLKGGLGFIAGIPKSYKSWFGLHFALAVATGGDFLGQKAKKANVLYIQEEDSERNVRLRMKNMMESVFPLEYQQTKRGQRVLEPSIQLRIQTGFVASDPDWLQKLEEFVEAHKIELVVIDTLMTVSGDIDIDKAREIRRDILNPLKDIGRKHDIAFCIIHHNTKGAGSSFKPGVAEVTRASTRMMGSGQLHAWADCGIYVRDKQGADVILETETKSSEDKAYRIRIEQNEPDVFNWNPVIQQFSDVAEQKEAVSPIQKQNGRQTPVIVRDLRKLGAIDERRAKAIDSLTEILGKTNSNLRAQVRRALASGQIAQTADERYYVL